MTDGIWHVFVYVHWSHFYISRSKKSHKIVEIIWKYHEFGVLHQKMSAKICFICNIASENCQINLAQIKSQHSHHPLLIFITKFLRKSTLNRSLYNADNCICENCLSRVNEYDSICVKAKRIEDELHKMLLKSDKSWHTSIEDDHSAEDIQDNRNDVGEIVSESSRDHESEVNQHSELIPKYVGSHVCTFNVCFND